MNLASGFLSLWICISGLEAAAPSAPLPRVPTGTDLAADQMECQKDTATCVATGHAVLTKTHGKKQYTLSADKLTAVMESHDGQMTVRETHADGHTTLESGDGRIDANKGAYNPQTHQAVFTGQPILQHNGNLLQGDELTADINTETYVLTGQPHHPVEGFITRDKA